MDCNETISNPGARRGAAAIEAAVCLPVLAIIIFASIEISGGIFQQYDAQAAAYEISKIALKNGNSCDDVQAAAQELLPQLGFESYNIEIDVVTRTANAASVETPAVNHFDIPSSGTTTPGLDQLPRGTLLKLTLTIDRPKIAGLGFFKQFLGTQISADCTFVKEF